MNNNVCGNIARQVLLLVLIFQSFASKSEGVLYPFGAKQGDKEIAWQDWETESEQINLDISLPLFGEGKMSSVWISSFGALTYKQLHTSSAITSINSATDNIAFAPYFVQSKKEAVGTVYYRQTTTNSELLEMVKDDVGSSRFSPSSITDIMTEEYNPTYALIVTWNDVASPDDLTLLNTFQIVLTTDGSRAFAVYSYDDTLQWSSVAKENTAAAGIFVSPNAEETCNHELQGSQTEEVSLLSQTLGNAGEIGRFILVISEPLQCVSKFQSGCDETLPSHDWGSSKPYFSITGDSWDVYVIHTCHEGFNIRTGIKSERIDCVYDPDYYSSAWQNTPSDCKDLNSTKKFEIITEVVQIGNDAVLSPANYTEEDIEELEKVIEDSIRTMLNLTDNADISITNLSIPQIPEQSNQRTDEPSTVIATVLIKIPPYTNKKMTADNITTILNDHGDIGDIIFLPATEVTDLTDPCLQGCMCRKKKDPKLCPKSKNPLIKPDSCCGGCDGQPYSSAIKACCNNQQVYNPLKARCCGGKVRKGAVGTCP